VLAAPMTSNDFYWAYASDVKEQELYRLRVRIWYSTCSNKKQVARIMIQRRFVVNSWTLRIIKSKLPNLRASHLTTCTLQ